MKKIRIFGMLAVAIVLIAGLMACDQSITLGDDDGGGGGDDGGDPWTGFFTKIKPTTLAVSGYGCTLLGDINGDGILDLIIVGGDASKAYTNDGNGTFTEIFAGTGHITNVGGSPTSSALGDIDGDSDLDLIVTGWGSDTFIYKNSGSGFFTEFVTLTGVNSGSIVLGDIDTNGTLDLIMTGLSGGWPKSIVYTNDGTGLFTEINTNSLIGVDQSAIALGDIDNDSDLDLILTGLTNGSDYSHVVSIIYQNDGTGSFAEINPGQLLGVCQGSVVLGDIDGDTDLDLIITGQSYNMGETTLVMGISINDGSGSFSGATWGLNDDQGLKNGALALADLNDDGKLDLIANNSIKTNTGSEFYWEHQLSPTGSDEFEIQTRPSMDLGDIDGDGDIDLILTGYGNTLDDGNRATIYINNLY